MKNKKAFTLVELIVVITILAILATIGFVGYSSYLVGTRDTNRVSQLKSISEALIIYNTKKSLPIPEDNVKVQVGAVGSEKTIAYQGYVGKNILEQITYSTEGVDPKDGKYFSYYLTKDKKYFQLMAFLEESTSLQDKTAFNISQVYAGDYEDRYPTVYGKKLGILTNEENTPIQEIQDIKDDGFLNISTTTDTYRARFKDSEEVLEGTGSLLVGINSKASCKRLYDAEGKRNDGKYKIDPEGNGTGFKVYCDMTTDGGGWTLVMRDFSNNRISSSEDGIKNPFSASSALLGNVSNKNSKYKLDTHVIGTKNSKILFKGWNIGQNVEHYVEAGKFNYVIVNKSLKDFGGTDKDTCNNDVFDNAGCDIKGMVVRYDSRGGNLSLLPYWFGDATGGNKFATQWNNTATNKYNYIWHEKGWEPSGTKTGTDPTTIKREVFIR